MILISVIITVETEILFYSHDKDISREESKELIKKSYPKVTALIYVLLIPIGTPLWLVGLGAALATFLGKLMFGGFAHQVFQSSLVGVLFVTLGWPQLVDSVSFMTSFDNYLIDLVFNNDFFNNTLSIGGIYDPDNMTSSLGMLLNGDMYPFNEVLLGLTPGVITSGIVLLLMFGYFVYKKTINWIIPFTMIVSFLIVSIIFGIYNNESGIYSLYHLFSGSFLFVAIFAASDPITTPIPTTGKIIFGVMAGAITVFIRNGVKYEEGVIFAVLFMNMLTPMLNETLKTKKKPVKKVPKKVGV